MAQVKYWLGFAVKVYVATAVISLVFNLASGVAPGIVGTLQNFANNPLGTAKGITGN